jgi:hypothetical protein
VSGATAYISGTFIGRDNACLLCFPCLACKLSYEIMISMRFGVYARWFWPGYATSPECRGGKGETTWRDRRSSTGLCKYSARYRAGLVACQIRLSTSGTRHVAPRRGKCLKIAIFGATGPTGVYIVRQALDRGFELKAFVRDPENDDEGSKACIS